MEISEDKILEEISAKSSEFRAELAGRLPQNTRETSQVALARDAAHERAERLVRGFAWNSQILPDPTSWLMSEKLDGLRGYWDGEKMWNAHGKFVEIPFYLKEQLPKEEVDGEIWIERNSYWKTLGNFRGDKLFFEFTFVIFDAPKLPGNFAERIEKIRAVLGEKSRVKVADFDVCAGKADLLRKFLEISSEGGEGLVLRNPLATYQSGQTMALFKIKPFFVVVAYVSRVPKDESPTLVLMPGATSGIEFRLGKKPDSLKFPGFTEGAAVEIRFEGFSTNGKPRSPAILRVLN